MKFRNPLNSVLLPSLILLAGVGVLCSNSATAQIADGSLLEDNIVITDLDGNEYDVFAMLDEGKTVVLDLFAEWCGPCWNYHQSGALEEAYELYGPEGTDELMIIAVETDASTPATSVTGGAGSTYGWDWTAGTPYPLANQNIGNIFEQAYYPYIIRICPNRQIFEIGQESASTVYSEVGTCLSASGNINPMLLSYEGETESCGDIDVRVKFQNLGTEPLESTNFYVNIGGEQVIDAEWTGELETYGVEEFTLGTVSLTENTVVEITTGDNDESPDDIVTMLSFGGMPTTNHITVKITLDANPEETTWEVLDATGAVVFSGGPYDASLANTVQTTTFDTELGCHQFVIYDEGDDGLTGGETNGSYWVTASGGSLIAAGGASSTWSIKKASFEVTTIDAVEDAASAAKLNLFPNPATQQFTATFDLKDAARLSVRMYDLTGRVVRQENFGKKAAGHVSLTADVGGLTPGVYFVEISSEDGLVRLGRRVTVSR